MVCVCVTCKICCQYPRTPGTHASNLCTPRLLFTRLGLNLLLLFDYPRLDNLDILRWSVLRPSLDHSHPFDGIHTRLHPAKDGMLAIEPRRRRKRDKELRPIRVWARVGHAQNASARVLQTWIDLVLELVPVDGASSATGPRWVATLDHEVRDDAMEDGVIVVAATDEGGEIVACLGSVSGVQLKRERTLQLIG